MSVDIIRTSPFTDTEARLLRVLQQRAPEAVSRVDLLTEVWGYHPASLTRTVENTIRRLRCKIESDPSFPRVLRTVRGRGYRWYGVGVAPVLYLVHRHDGPGVDHAIAIDDWDSAVRWGLAEAANGAACGLGLGAPHSALADARRLAHVATFGELALPLPGLGHTHAGTPCLRITAGGSVQTSIDIGHWHGSCVRRDEVP